MEITSANMTIPVVRGFFGPRVGSFSTSLSITEIKDLLRHDPRSANWKILSPALQQLYAEVQRKTKTQRLTGIKRYIDDRFVSQNAIAGAFPSVSIAITGYCGFEGLGGDRDHLIGTLRIAASPSCRAMVIDGLGRISAALDILDEMEAAGYNMTRRNEAETRIGSFRFPCVIFAPRRPDQTLAVADLQQLFHDFNFLAAPIGKAQAISLDHADIYKSVARNLGGLDLIANYGGMKIHSGETRGRKPKGKPKAVPSFVSFDEMIVFVRTAAEGQDWGLKPFREMPENPRLTALNAEDTTRDLAEFLEAVRRAMGGRWTDRSSLHLTVKGWFAMGAVWRLYHLERCGADMGRVASAVASIDWRASSPIWVDVVRMVEAGPGRRLPYTFLATGHTPKIDVARIVISEVDRMLAEEAL